MMTEEQMDQFEYDMLMEDEEYTLEEYEEYSKWIIDIVENIMENSDEHEEQYAFSKIYHKLNDIDIGVKVIKELKELKALNKQELNKKEYTIDDFKEYYKAPTKFVRNIRSKYADDKDLVYFCDMVLDDLDCVDSISHLLKGKNNLQKDFTFRQ